jgi:acyl dehydratase
MPEPLRFVVAEVAEADVIAMMDVMGDTNPVHSDHELVGELGLRGLVNQGPSNLAYALNMVIDWAGGEPAAVLGFDARFHAITCPGDRLVASGEVVAEGAPGEPSTLAFRLERETASTPELILTGTARVTTPEGEHARR